MSDEWTGTVVKKAFAPGSKSEHEAIMLVSEGRELRLRRQGGHPFYDPELAQLVGKTLRFRGVQVGSDLIVSEWSER